MNEEGKVGKGEVLRGERRREEGDDINNQGDR